MRTRSPYRLPAGALLALALTAPGCGANYYAGSQGGAAGGGGGLGHLPDAAAGRDGTPSIDPTADAESCGGEEFTLTRGLPPDVLIVLDRSASMAQTPPGGGAIKYVQVLAAIRQVVQILDSEVRFGMEFFPTDMSCGIDAVDIPVAPNNFGPIAGAADIFQPGGNTPTADAIHFAGSYLGTLGTPNPKYIVLATDGYPNCITQTVPCMCPPGWSADPSSQCVKASDPTQHYACDSMGGSGVNTAYAAIADLASRGIFTYVIGIATSATEQVGLNVLAEAGGAARSGPIEYYPTTNQADFAAAMSSIAMGVASCSFTLTMPPPDRDRVSVLVGGNAAPRDPSHMNGWDYGPGGTTVQLYGSWCDMVRTGNVTEVRAVFGCSPLGILKR
jgi:hypothetical protein